MKVIYHCYGGSHASPVAAAIHLQTLPADRIPTKEEILALQLFDQVSPAMYGTLFPLGLDNQGNEVFVLGARNDAEILLKVLKGVTRMIGEDYQDYLFVDVKPCINIWMRIGGFLSRAVGLIRLGRPLVTWGVRKAYPALVGLVEQTHSRLSHYKDGSR